MTAPVAAVVLGSRGGSRLGRALESVAWVSERVVLDPAERLAGEKLPAGVVRSADAFTAIGAPWVLLLEECETIPPALETAIATAINGPAACAAYRVALEVQGLGLVLHPPGAPIRLARRPGARLRWATGLRLELAPGEGSVGRFPDRIVAVGADSLAGAIDDLDADAGALAGLLYAHGASPGLRHLALTPLLSSARTLVARGAGAPWRRWALAVLAGYRTTVAYAKLWELRRAEAAHAS
jgi:hypothetical protein